MWKEGPLCNGKQRAGSNQRKRVGRTKEVWRMFEKRRRRWHAYWEKSIAKQCMGKRPERHSQRRGYSKGSLENFQNVKRSVVGYWY